MDCVAHAETVINEQRVKDKRLDLVPISLRRADVQSVEEYAPIICPSSVASTSAQDGPASPISKLSEEVLIMIFDDVITSESPSKYRPGHAPSGQPLNPPRKLASVSKAWRTIVFACPMLWRHVVLTPTQPIHALKEHLHNSSPFPIHLTVKQWPFRNPIAASGPHSIIALTGQLQSILLPIDKGGELLAPACHRIESITINATESSTFLNFVLQTWTGRGSKFPMLRHVIMNGHVRAMWSRSCLFDGKNAPSLERLELRNVLIAYSAYRLPWGSGINLTTLVWSSPLRKQGSILVSVACFHHIIASFPQLTHLELYGRVVGLEFATVDSLEGSDITPLTHIRDLRISGRLFSNGGAAFLLFSLLPAVMHLVVRGRGFTGPLRSRTVVHALHGLTFRPTVFSRPMVVLPDLEDFEVDCVDRNECAGWEARCAGELEQWRQWRDTVALATKQSHVKRVRIHMMTEEQNDSDEGESDEDA